MRFLIVTHVQHTKSGDQLFAYGPYTREMNLWIKQVAEVIIVAPVSDAVPNPIDLPYKHRNITLVKVKPLCFTSFKKALASVITLPGIFFRVVWQMKRAHHIHLRCPGNMGLIGCVAQLFFPGKTKTAKYAANWDLKSKQPLSYRVQQTLIKNTVLTKNMTGLVYGRWPDQTRNIKPFFTASYTQAERLIVKKKSLNGKLRLMFAGSLSAGKQPLLSAKVCWELNQRGVNAELHFYGEGKERVLLEDFIRQKEMQQKIFLHGNQPQAVLQEAFRQCHFLIFLSKSEGWPKAVAEAMWWGCLPITSAVSCVPEMIGFGERGDVVNGETNETSDLILSYLKAPALYYEKCAKAAAWARQYTTELFESEINKILHGESPSAN